MTQPTMGWGPTGLPPIQSDGNIFSVEGPSLMILACAKLTKTKANSKVSHVIISMKY